MKNFLSRRLGVPVWALFLGAFVLLGLGSAAGSSSTEKDATATTQFEGATGTAETTASAPLVTTTTVTTPPTTTPPPQQVAQFSGATGKQTPTFTVPAGAKRWTIDWDFKGSSNNIVRLMSPPDETVGGVLNTIGPSKDQSTFYTHGTFFFDVSGDRSWSLVVTAHFD